MIILQEDVKAANTEQCCHVCLEDFGGSQSMKRRLPNIIHNAGSLRGLASQYRNEARLALHEARRARERGAEEKVITFLQEVRMARAKSKKCASFAVLCERRADTLETLTRPVWEKN